MRKDSWPERREEIAGTPRPETAPPANDATARKEKEETEARERLAFFELRRERLSKRHVAESELANLRSLVERGLITAETLTHAIEDGVLSPEEIDTLFLRIEEMESVEKYEEIVSAPYRITREEFLRAVQEEASRPAAMAKIEGALRQVARGGGVGQKGMVGSLLLLLSTSLRTAQENLIDLKRGLELAARRETEASASQQ